MHRERAVVRVVRLLHDGVLWAYPSGLEREYREEIAADTARMLDAAHARAGWTGVMRLCPGMFADLLGGLLSSHARSLTDAVGRCSFQSIALDFRHAVRAARGGGSTTALMLGLLAVAVATQAVVLAALDGVLLRPLPYAAPDRLVTLYELSTMDVAARQAVAPGNFLSWRAEASSFAALAASTTATMTAAAPSGPTAVRVTRVTTDFFRVFAREPAAGRVLRTDDFDGAVWHSTSGYVGTVDAAVISEELAVRQFGTPDGAIGRAIQVEGRNWRVVGVMDAAFNEAAGTGDLWLPWDLQASYIRSGLPGAPRTFRFLTVHGRLTTDVTVASAEREVVTIASRLATEYPVENRGFSAVVAQTSKDVVAPFAPTLVAVSLAIQLVLLLAAANVSSLLFSHNLSRVRGFAIRRLLGASGVHIFREISFETLLIVGIATTSGIWLGLAVLPEILTLVPKGTPRASNILIDARTIVMTVSVAAVFALALSIGTYLQIAPAARADRLREIAAAVVGLPMGRTRRVVVSVQVALALTIVVSGVLIVRSLVGLQRVPLGFDGSDVSVVRVALDRARYDSPRAAAFYAEFIATLKSLPGVTAAGAVTALPLSEIGADFDRPFWPEGPPPDPGTAREARITMVTPGYFRTMDIALLTGRDFSGEDGPGALRAIVVNQALAAHAWPGEEAVGRSLTVDYQGGQYPYRVIGVATNTLHDGPRRLPVPEIFIPHAQNPYPLMNVVVRSTLPPSTVAAAASQVLARLDAALTIQSPTTMSVLQMRNVANERLAAWLLFSLALVAVAVATVGLYGVVSLTVSQRRREVALRVALGATRSDLYQLFVRWGLVSVTAGCAAGLLGAVIAGRHVAPLLFGIGPRDPLTLVGALTLVLVISTGAMVLAISRAATTDPSELLRAQ
jgi:predicted permease